MAGKSQQFLKLRDDKLYAIVNGFDKYVSIKRNSTSLFSHFSFGIIKIFIKTYFIIKFINNLK